jgi:hypothetical protein
MLCRSCTPGRCNSLSTEENKIEVECPVCDGVGCSHCTDGVFPLNGCPNAFCGKMVTLIDVIDLFGKGLPPVAGGTLDQSVSFIQAAAFFESEERKVRNERSSRNSD